MRTSERQSELAAPARWAMPGMASTVEASPGFAATTAIGSPVRLSITEE